MARAFGASGMLDIRSVSILFDVEFANLEWTRPKPQFRKDLDTLPLRDKVSFDARESWILLLYSVLLGALGQGVLHACAFMGEFGTKALDMTPGQLMLILAGMYGSFLITSPIACISVKSWTPRHATTFGCLLGFFGLVLMAIQVHKIVFVIGTIFFVGPGCSFIQTATGCCVVDFFKGQIATALVILSLASPIGTLIFTLYSYFAGIDVLFKYKWILITYALFFITATSMSRQFPRSTRIPGHQDSIRAVEVAQRIKKCLQMTPLKGIKVENPPPDSSRYVQKPGKLLGEFTYTCACFVDIGMLKDLTFCLWAIVSSCAMVTLYVPHVCFADFIKFELGYGYKEALQYICVHALGSIVGRVVGFFSDDFSFLSTRIFFGSGLLANAITYFVIHIVETWGWMLTVYLVLGLLEGFFVILIPRMTLHIFPRKYLSSIWQLLMPCHGLAVFIGPTLMAFARNTNNGEIFLACIFVGVVQVIAIFLSMLLPEYIAEVKDKKRNRRRRRSVPESIKINVRPKPIPRTLSSIGIHKVTTPEFVIKKPGIPEPTPK